MNHTETRQLGFFSLAALLVSAHYGLGFVLGTAEKALTLGWAGSLYPISIALGTLVLLAFARFYWRSVEPIWTLLGNRYGHPVKVLVGTMSWLSLIGIFAVQIIAGAFILKVLDLPVQPSMLGLALIFLLSSILPIEKASWLFRGLLGFNILALLYAIAKLHAVPLYLHAPVDFIPALHQMSPPALIGISLSTVLLVLIDMKYHQFVVQARDMRSLYLGCVLAAILFLFLALLPSAVVIATKTAGILPTDIDGKAIIPWILLWLGGGANHLGGQLLILSLIVPALGVGSSILRVQTKVVLDFELFPDSQLNRLIVAIINTALGLAVALKGGSIISLIVLFYAVYVATVWVPFAAYLIAETGRYTFAASSVRLALIISGLSAVAMLILSLIKPDAAFFNSAELSIIILGIGFGCLGLGLGEIIEKYLPISPIKEEL